VGTAPEVTPNLSLDLGSVSGWGFDAGASLVLVAPTTVVARSGAAPAGGYRFDPELAAAQGFGTVRLSAQGDVTVPAGQALAPVLQRWQLTDAWRAAA
jgi:hypothetical protein